MANKAKMSEEDRAAIEKQLAFVGMPTELRGAILEALSHFIVTDGDDKMLESFFGAVGIMLEFIDRVTDVLPVPMSILSQENPKHVIAALAAMVLYIAEHSTLNLVKLGEGSDLILKPVVTSEDELDS